MIRPALALSIVGALLALAPTPTMACNDGTNPAWNPGCAPDYIRNPQNYPQQLLQPLQPQQPRVVPIEKVVDAKTLEVLRRPPPTEGVMYGAVAYDRNVQQMSLSKRGPSPQYAEWEAVEGCKHMGGTTCELIVKAYVGCLALATTDDRDAVVGWSIEDTVEQAMPKAMGVCMADHGNACKVVAAICSHEISGAAQ